MFVVEKGDKMKKDNLIAFTFLAVLWLGLFVYVFLRFELIEEVVGMNYQYRNCIKLDSGTISLYDSGGFRLSTKDDYSHIELSAIRELQAFAVHYLDNEGNLMEKDWWKKER